MKKKYDAGILPSGHSWWHRKTTSKKPVYWHGWMPEEAKPEEVFVACLTTCIDLLKNHPDLMIQIQDRLKF